MSMRNSVRLIGHLGKDPDIKNAGKSKLARFTLATSETYTNDKGEKVTETQWHNIICWGKKAEIAENYLKKGRQIAIDGSLRTNSYEDKDGVKRHFTEVNVMDLVFLDAKGNK